MNYTVATTYFEVDGDTRRRRLLENWMERYLQSGSLQPVLVLTDAQTQYRKNPRMVLEVREHNPAMRPGQPLDRKGAIVCEAILRLGPVLIIDTDAIVQKALPDHAPWMESALALPLNQHAVPATAGLALTVDGTMIPKRNAGIMWFGDTSRRDGIVQSYWEAFHRLQSHPDMAREPAHLLEQHAWSVAGMSGEVIPDEWNWPEHRVGPNPNAFIYHYHGVDKFNQP